MINDIYQSIVEAGSVLIRSKEMTYKELRDSLPMPKSDLDKLIKDIKQDVKINESKI